MSLASDVIAIIDPVNPKQVKIFDINSCKAGQAFWPNENLFTIHQRFLYLSLSLGLSIKVLFSFLLSNTVELLYKDFHWCFGALHVY